MGWGASNREIVARLKARMVECKTCGHCLPRPMKKGDRLKENDCARQPLQVFFTDAPRQCRYHTKMEWLASKGVELK